MESPPKSLRDLFSDLTNVLLETQVKVTPILVQMLEVAKVEAPKYAEYLRQMPASKEN